MGQVPYGLIGSGRAAKHLKYYFQLLGLEVETWSRSTDSEIAPDEKLSACRTVLLAISDRALEPFIRRHPRLITKKLVHLSGGLYTSLAPSAHPLVAFGDVLFSPDFYPKIPFVWERGSSRFQDFFPELRNPHFEIEPTQKSLYHALCVFSGNFSTLLWQGAARQMHEKFDIPFEALVPYLDSVVGNLKHSPDTALTGPLARRDHETLQRDLDALRDPATRQIFLSFINTYVPGPQESRREADL